MIGRILGRHGDPPRKAAKSGPAARAFLHLARDGAVAEESGPSPARRAAGLFLALMVLAAMPLYWVSAASGHGGDQPAAVKSGSSGPGSGEEDDEGGHDDPSNEGDDSSATGTTRGTGPSNTNTNDTNTGTRTDPTGTTAGTGPSNTGTGDTRTGTRTGA
jgi:hypothetical protein